jgi:hypothetical protein
MAMSLLSRITYRVRQLGRTLSPTVSREEVAAAQAALGPQLFPLFAAMQATDQRHCLDVYELLRHDGETDPDILQAALIHDAGKGGEAAPHIRTWHRVAYVLLPDRLVDRITGGNGGFARLHRHGDETVALARAAGASQRIIGLLQAMESGHTDDPGAARLLAADDKC